MPVLQQQEPEAPPPGDEELSEQEIAEAKAIGRAKLLRDPITLVCVGGILATLFGDVFDKIL